MNMQNPEGYTTADGRQIGGVLMEMKTSPCGLAV